MIRRMACLVLQSRSLRLQDSTSQAEQGRARQRWQHIRAGQGRAGQHIRGGLSRASGQGRAVQGRAGNTFWGSSLATESLRRRSMKGLSTWCSRLVTSRDSSSFSMADSSL